jgi:glutaredoxin
MTEVTLYRRRECGLCDDALFELRQLSSELRFTFVERDIDRDADLRARYNDIIPVVAIGETVIAHAPIDLGELRDALEGRIARRT